MLICVLRIHYRSFLQSNTWELARPVWSQ